MADIKTTPVNVTPNVTPQASPEPQKTSNEPQKPATPADDLEQLRGGDNAKPDVLADAQEKNSKKEVENAQHHAGNSGGEETQAVGQGITAVGGIIALVPGIGTVVGAVVAAVGAITSLVGGLFSSNAKEQAQVMANDVSKKNLDAQKLKTNRDPKDTDSMQFDKKPSLAGDKLKTVPAEAAVNTDTASNQGSPAAKATLDAGSKTS